jgi:hypothetical protein
MQARGYTLEQVSEKLKELVYYLQHQLCAAI